MLQDVLIITFTFCFDYQIISHRTQGNTAQFPPYGLSTASAAAAPRSPYRHLELRGIAPEQEKPRPFLAGASDCRKRCAHPLAPSARGLRPQAVGERTVRLSEIFRAMARFSPSAPSGHLPRRGRFFDTLSCLRPLAGRLFFVLNSFRFLFFYSNPTK